jgi:hypothetical protein
MLISAREMLKGEQKTKGDTASPPSLPVPPKFS